METLRVQQENRAVRELERAIVPNTKLVVSSTATVTILVTDMCCDCCRTHT